MDINLVLIVLNSLLVVVTAAYVVLTYRIMESNRNAVNVMKEQVESFYRPYITVTHYLRTNTLISLHIKNAGKTNAQNLRLKIDKDYFQVGKRNKEFNIAKLPLFTNVIESFPPESEIVLSLGSTAAIKDKTPDDPETPVVFKVTAKYSYTDKTVSETTTVDLRIYRSTFMPHEPLANQFDKVSDELKEIRVALTKRNRAT